VAAETDRPPVVCGRAPRRAASRGRGRRRIRQAVLAGQGRAGALGGPGRRAVGGADDGEQPSWPRARAVRRGRAIRRSAVAARGHESSRAIERPGRSVSATIFLEIETGRSPVTNRARGGGPCGAGPQAPRAEPSGGFAMTAPGAMRSLGRERDPRFPDFPEARFGAAGGTHVDATGRFGRGTRWLRGRAGSPRSGFTRRYGSGGDDPTKPDGLTRLPVAGPGDKAVAPPKLAGATWLVGQALAGTCTSTPSTVEGAPGAYQEEMSSAARAAWMGTGNALIRAFNPKRRRLRRAGRARGRSAPASGEGRWRRLPGLF